MVGELRSCFLDMLPGEGCATIFAEAAHAAGFFIV